MHVYMCVLKWYFKLYICFIDKTSERPKRSAKRTHTQIHSSYPHTLNSRPLKLPLFYSLNSIVYVCFLFTISYALIRLRFPFHLLFLFLLLLLLLVEMVVLFFPIISFTFSLVCQFFFFFLLFFPYKKILLWICLSVRIKRTFSLSLLLAVDPSSFLQPRGSRKQ